MYRIETTDPITGKSLKELADMPYVIEDKDDDRLVIYFESRDQNGWNVFVRIQVSGRDFHNFIIPGVDGSIRGGERVFQAVAVCIKVPYFQSHYSHSSGSFIPVKTAPFTESGRR